MADHEVVQAKRWAKEDRLVARKRDILSQLRRDFWIAIVSRRYVIWRNEDDNGSSREGRTG